MLAMKRWTACVVLATLSLAVLTGCPPKPTGTPTGSAHEEGEKPPPHNGTLFATKDHKVHIELVLDKKENKAEAYLFDANVEKPVRTPAESLTLTIKGSPPKTVTFKPEPQKDDPPGQSSHFVTSEPLPADVKMKDVELSVIINKNPYVFTLDED